MITEYKGKQITWECSYEVVERHDSGSWVSWATGTDEEGKEYQATAIMQDDDFIDVEDIEEQ